MIKRTLQALIEGRDLSEEQASCAMQQIMEGGATSAQVSSFLTALRIKGETCEEIQAMASVMRQKARRVHTSLDAVDTCGTGGDGVGTFNVSTAAAFVIAGAGQPVAKHGNRAMSSACGSADVLEALGVNIVLSPGSVAQCLAETRIAFMFAQTFHPAMKHVAPVRREIGVRTIFNVLGPLTNPAGAPYQVIGVSTPFVMSRMAHALGQLGSRRALVVHGAGGVDELSLSGTNAVCEWTGTEVRNYSLRARDLGLKQAPISAISGGSPEHNAKIVMAVLEAEPGAPRDTVLLNAAAGLYVSGRATSMTHGVRLAAESIDSGAALGTLRALVAESNRLGAIEKEGSVA